MFAVRLWLFFIFAPFPDSTPSIELEVSFAQGGSLSVNGLGGASSETLTRFGSERFKRDFSPPFFVVAASPKGLLTVTAPSIGHRDSHGIDFNRHCGAGRLPNYLICFALAASYQRGQEKRIALYCPSCVHLHPLSCGPPWTSVISHTNMMPFKNTACSPFWIGWQLTHKLWVPLIKLLPKSWWDGWLEYD